MNTLTAQIGVRAKADPGLLAARCAGLRLTRGELAQRSDKLAHLLRGHGVHAGERVGIAVSPSLQMVVALVATLKTGAAYLPLDPADPDHRIDHALSDSRPLLVLHDSGGAAIAVRAQQLGHGALSVDDLAGLGEHAETGQRELPSVHPDGLCYLIYTSGSTGVPKAAMTQHAGICATITPVAELAGLHEGRRLLHVSSLNWDMSVFEIFGPLVTGAELVIATAEERSSPRLLLDRMHADAVHLWSSAPAVLSAVVEAAEQAGRPLNTELRTVLVGGDRLAPALVRRLAALAPQASILNVAGVTEVSYCSMCYRVTLADADRATVPWGPALPGQYAYVLDPSLRPTADGEAGQLYLGGTGVGPGYWRRSSQTAQRFVPDPFNPPGRMFRTGDLVRRLPDGSHEFLGRDDGQVKVGGVRIEPGEIESALERHPDVGAAVVSARQVDGHDQLIAYVRGADGRIPKPRECQRFLHEWLPEYLTPHRIVVLDRFPLLPNGKIDRGALPLPAPPGSSRDSPATPPDLVVLVARTFADICAREEFPADDDFFASGGNSLLAAEIVGALRRRLGVGIPVRLLFEAPTPRLLAGQLSALQPDLASLGRRRTRAQHH